MVAERESMNYSREIPIRHDVDVLVAGGGPAGVAAALTASRNGASVHVIEGHSCFGGMGTAGQVPLFMQFTDGVNFLAGGIGKEILDALQAAKGTYPEDGLAIRAEVLKRVYDDLMTAADITFTFHTQLVDVSMVGGTVREAVCAGKNGLFGVRAKVFIDGTGNGDLATFAGARYEKGDAQGHMMPGTLCSIWSDIDWKKVEEGGLGAGNSRIEDAFRDGVFSLEDRHLPGIWRMSEHVGNANIGHTFDVDGTDEESLTEAYLWGRKSLKEYERYYKEYMKGFEEMELVSTGSLLGVRETRRIIGDYILNVEDFKSRAIFDDEIGRYSYAVDIHIARPDKESYENFREEFATLRYGTGESYGIPYRVLTPVGLDNVLVAGRCVSTDRQMQASIRVMPGCYITGQAAGMAAALMTEHGTDSRGVDIATLQAKLKDMGGFLPNFEK